MLVRAVLSEHVGAVIAGVSAGEPSGHHSAFAKWGEGEMVLLFQNINAILKTRQIS